METPARHLPVGSLDSPRGAALPSPPPGFSFTEEQLSLLQGPLPPAGSAEEDERFRLLQGQLVNLWYNLTEDPQVDQTVVVVPSLSLDAEELQKLKGATHYEERMLFLLILLRMPRTRVVFISSMPIPESIVAYYLQLLPGVPFTHARRRLHMFSTYDNSSDRSLTQKILDRPILLERVRRALAGSSNAHLTVFNVTWAEKSLAVALGLPLLGADPSHLHYGTKSGARKLFRAAGVPFAEGLEDLRDEREIAEAIVTLAERNPGLRRVVIKINEGFSGEGNSIYPLDELRVALDELRGALGEPRDAGEPAGGPGGGPGGPWDRGRAVEIVQASLPRLARQQAPGLSWARFLAKFKEMQGIVEEFLEGERKESPSVQLRITPLKEAQIISTHEQILGGLDGQVFLGCRFPAEASYLQAMHQHALAVGERLAEARVTERLSVDFLAVEDHEAPDGWRLYAVEINLRKGGTTHPFRTLQFLTGGRYNPDSGLFETPSGQPKHYVASDNLESPGWRGMLAEDLIDITTFTHLHYNSSSHTGVVFHLIGALSQYGKLGVTCVGNSRQEADDLYERTLATLEEECRTTRWMI